MKKPAPTYKPGDDKLFPLFDTFQMERVCELVEDSYDPAPEGHRGRLSQSLTRLLIQPIESFIERLYETGRGVNASEFEAADELRACAENVAESLATSDDGTCAKHEAGELADDLHRAWIKFIAYASAHRMYADLPREMETNVRKTKPMREVRDAMAYAAQVDHLRIIERYSELLAAEVRGKRKTLAKEFGLSESMISKIWNERAKYKRTLT